MVNENHELLLELWSRIKSHVQPKERLEVADIMVVVFDEFGLLEDDFLHEDLDKELHAAAISHLSSSDDLEEYEAKYDDESDFTY